ELVRESDERLESPCTAGRAQAELEPDLVALDHAFPLDRDGRAHVHVALEQQGKADNERKRESKRDELRAAEDESPHKTETGEAGVGAELRGGRAYQPRAGTTSSAAGVGTVSSCSRTTSSARMRCTQSSGRSAIRWASAGTATAFTSSGVTKSRPS